MNDRKSLLSLICYILNMLILIYAVYVGTKLGFL